MNELFITNLKKVFILCSIVLAVGLLVGGVIGWVIGKNTAQGENEPNIAVIETVAPTVETVSTETVIDDTPHFESIGTFTTTAYCCCEKCCGKSDGITATGAKAQQGITIAVDPSVIPYGSTVMINGVSYIAQDTMAKSIKDKYAGRVIDIYFDSHEAAKEYGVQEHEIYILREGA